MRAPLAVAATGNLARHLTPARLGPHAVTFTRASQAFDPRTGLTVGIDVPRTRQLGAYTEWYLEPSRTNRLTASEPASLTDVPINGGATVTATGNAVAPYLTGHVAFGDNSVSRYAYKNNYTLVGSTQYTASFRVRMDDGLAPVVGTNSANGDFNIIVGGDPATPGTPILLPNGEYLVFGTLTTAVTPASNSVGIVKYTTNTARTFKVTGYQLEEGAFPTSYMRTTTAAAQRALDDADVAATLPAGDMLLATKSFTTGLWSYVWIAHPGGAYQVLNDNGVILLEYAGRTLTAAVKQSESDKLKAALITDGQQIDAGWV